MSKKAAAKKPTKNALVPAKPTSSKLPAKMGDKLLAFSGAGMEGVTARDIIIPRLTALQVLSPQCQKSKPEYIKGAEPGMFCDTATGKTFDGEEGVRLLFVHYKLNWLEWAPRKSNRGLVQVHDNDAILAHCKKDEKGKFVTPEGNTVVETAQLFGLNLDDGDRQFFASFFGTQRKKAKKLMTLATSERITHSSGKEFIPPLFYRQYMATLAMESNAEGEWYGWNFARGETIEDDDALFEKAMNYLKSIQTGAARMSEEELVRAATMEANRGDSM